MVTYTETAHAAEFILSEANGARSRENGVGGATLPAGSVVKLSSSKFVTYNGSGTVVGILLYDTVLDQKVSYIARDAEVNQKLLSSTEQTSGEISTGAIAGLLALGIICRD